MRRLALAQKLRPAIGRVRVSGVITSVRHAINKRRATGAILWLCWGLLLGLGFSNANHLSATYPAVSLRYHTSLSSAAAASARGLAAESAAAGNENTGFWPTFWTEQEDIAVQGLHSTAARCLWFSGDAALVWPAEFVHGGAPGMLDESGCAISDTLAWQLWGNVDVLDYELTASGQTRIVRGVFREDGLLVMAGTGEAAFKDGWQAVELAGMPDGEVRAVALGFAQASGLGTPDTLVDGPALSAVADLLSLLPLVLMSIALLFGLLRRITKALPGKTTSWVLAFAILLAFAWALPALLEMLPPSFIPTRFSDFAFWGRLAASTWEHVKEWLLLRPSHIDVQAKLLLYAQVGIFVAQSIISAVLMCRNLAAQRGFTTNAQYTA